MKQKKHYVYIKDYNKLISKQNNKDAHKCFHCRYCQHGFKKEENLDKHYINGCMAIEGQTITLPTKEEVTKFKNLNRKFECPFIIYADTECNTNKLNQFDDNKSTNNLQLHTMNSYGFNVVKRLNNTNTYYS